MAVTVSAKNYTVISGCESSTDGGTWLILTAQDGADRKQGTYSLCGTVKAAGANIVTFTPTVAKDLSGVKHVRWWMVLAHGGLLETYAYDGLNFWCSDGTNTGYWKILGRDTYTGGWINCCIDVSKNCDSGIKPSAMNAITSMGFRITLTGAAKNAVNTWVDHLHMCDGLVARGDDAGGYFDIDDVFSADDATTGGWGVVRKIGGMYFLTGSLEVGIAAAATKFQTKSSVLVFEKRRVNDALYGITVTEDGTNATEFILGSKAGTAGIEGCVVRVEDVTQTCKFFVDARTDTDVDNFKLYGSTFLDASTLKFPNQPSGKATVHRARASNIATLGVNAHGLIAGNAVLVAGLGGTGYNGTWTVVSVPDANHFTFQNTGNDEGETPDTGGTSTSLNVEVLNTNFESCDEVQATTCVMTNCAFVSANDEAVVLPDGDVHQLTESTFVNCPYAVRIPNANTYTFTGLTFVNNTKDIDNTSGGSVIVNCVESNPTTYTGNTTINNPRYFTITGLVANSEVRIYRTSDMSELAGTESSGTSFQYPYNWASDIPITYVIFNLQYQPIYRTDVLEDTDKSVPAFQIYDRNYENP